MKEHKEIKISFDIINNRVKNAKYEGAKEDLVSVLCWGGPDFFDAAINSMLRFYLEQPSREEFMAKFLSAAASLDSVMLSNMKLPKDLS